MAPRLVTSVRESDRPIPAHESWKSAVVRLADYRKHRHASRRRQEDKPDCSCIKLEIYRDALIDIADILADLPG